MTMTMKTHNYWNNDCTVCYNESTETPKRLSFIAYSIGALLCPQYVAIHLEWLYQI